jgi:hypothetical protein
VLVVQRFAAVMRSALHRSGRLRAWRVLSNSTDTTMSSSEFSCKELRNPDKEVSSRKLTSV